MNTSREWLIQWLRDVHAMEEQAETMLSGLHDRIENYPELRNRIRTHLDETRVQAERIRTCLASLGAGSSSLKDAAAKILAAAQSVSGAFGDDEVLKGCLASYSFEHVEIASYTMLSAAAETCGEMGVVQVCQQNLREEVAMAEWMHNHLGSITKEFLTRADAKLKDAKR
ncbi:hypothetical protein ASC75_23875 [Aminobacter sp. DSM 101952]|uniref:YciE/YciF ferroxidase family protein n=1 Tax=Aminobacter sp. DSM 101952 TaxID=2735891 RepID=UPI0006FD3FE9|nr:DUF892 family protein [Aminobacter sp. DSM 101952]KQU72426.1 hypothetical protein ASC75_23875 [Aminobacter sp. DSM 101952]